jgi:hypothetical protein
MLPVSFFFRSNQRKKTQPQPEAAPATEVALVPGTNQEEPNFMQEADLVPVTITIPS